MTAQEICEKYNYSLSSLTSNFNRVAKQILKNHHVRIIKEGRGKDVVYIELEDDNRALTMYEEVKDNIGFSRDTVQLANWNFFTLVTIILTPMLVFRGSYKEFLKYAETPMTAANIQHLKGALEDLRERELIMYQVDKTSEDYFIAGLYRKVEEDIGVGVQVIRRCKEIASKNNKRQWMPILKTYVGLKVMETRQPYTVAELSEYTGLSEYNIRESVKLLEGDNFLKTDIAYIDGTFLRLGKNVAFNALNDIEK